MLVDGHSFRVACKRRDCPRCWARRSRELARVLVLDARQEAPRYCMTLTTSAPWEELDPEDFRRGVENVTRRLRRRFGRVEYFAAVEFTTGTAARSGGHRRMHAHALLKVGAPTEIEATGAALRAREQSAGVGGRRDFDVIEVERLVRTTWQKRTGAFVVEVAQLVSPGAALGYLALHHRKPSQAPPASWRGMSERASRGYWSTPIAELRERARRELAIEAFAHRHGLALELAALEFAARAEPRLIDTRQSHGSQLRESLGAPW